MEMVDVIYEITERGPVMKDPDLRSQLRRAASKTAPQIAEGFLRYTAPEFVRFLRMARSSVGEVQNHLEMGRRRHYFSEDQLSRATLIAKRAMVAVSRLLKSKLPPE